MKISELIEELERQRDSYGDVEVTMDAILGDDVFESTVETSIFLSRNSEDEYKRIKLFWQM